MQIQDRCIERHSNKCCSSQRKKKNCQHFAFIDWFHRKDVGRRLVWSLLLFSTARSYLGMAEKRPLPSTAVAIGPPWKRKTSKEKKKCTWFACVVSCLKNFLNWRAPTLEWCIYLYFMQNKILWGACCEVNAESVCLSVVAGAAAILVSGGGVHRWTALLQNRELHACLVWMTIWKGKIIVVQRFFWMLSFILYLISG